MLRQILAIVGGFLLWSVLWLLLGQTLTSSGLLPGAGEPLSAPLPLIALLAGSVVISLVSGYVAAALAKARINQTGVALGIVLLAVGIAVQSQYWNLMPLWYHLSFLACLIPSCLIGARFRQRQAKAR